MARAVSRLLSLIIRRAVPGWCRLTYAWLAELPEPVGTAPIKSGRDTDARCLRPGHSHFGPVCPIRPHLEPVLRAFIGHKNSSRTLQQHPRPPWQVPHAAQMAVRFRVQAWADRGNPVVFPGLLAAFTWLRELAQNSSRWSFSVSPTWAHRRHRSVPYPGPGAGSSFGELSPPMARGMIDWLAAFSQSDQVWTIWPVC